MLIKKFFFGLALTFSLGVTTLANAFDPNGLDAHEVAKISSAEVLKIVSEGRAERIENTKELTEKILVVLEPVVAFDAISRSVMGKYRKQATPDQMEKFAAVFKDTMVNLYARALISFESDKIEILPQTGKPHSKKAKVEMEVSGVDGTVYKVVYSMRKNKEGVWQARNMIVDGINLGLTYLNQFDSAMNRYDGDIDQVIGSWQQDMETNGDTAKVANAASDDEDE